MESISLKDVPKSTKDAYKRLKEFCHKERIHLQAKACQILESSINKYLKEAKNDKKN